MEIYIAATSIRTALGGDVKSTFEAIVRGESGLGLTATGGRVSSRPVIAGLIPEAEYDSLEKRFGSGYSRAELLAAEAVLNVIEPLRTGRGRTGLVIATAKGNISMLEGKCSNGHFIPDEASPILMDVFARRIAALSGIPSESVTVVSNACISGVTAIVIARRMILGGDYDNVAVVGVDVQNRFIVSGFASFKSLSPEICRPYDESRCGLNLGEACGAILLTNDREIAGPDALRVDGGAVSDDANHISGPSRTGDGLFFAMRNAADEAGIPLSGIDAVQLHGTATVYNDEMESKAMALTGLSEVPAQSLKPYFGHTMGASGVIETIMLAEEMKHGILAGTAGFTKLGTPCPLSISSETRRVEMKHCIKTASGFGGTNAAIVLSQPGTSREIAPTCLRKSLTVRTVKVIDGSIEVDGKPVLVSEAGFDTFIREAYKSRGSDNMKFYKMDSASKLAYIAAEWLLDGVDFGEEECAVLMSGRYGSLDTDMNHQSVIDSDGEDYAAPSVFVYTLPNVAAAEISIRHHIKGENIWFCSGDATMADLRHQAELASGRETLKYCIIGHSDFINGEYFAIFELLRFGER
ncbi:MAG: beta-ketoacyl synthase N-terminal-like domain-containing protein [Candidatus Cryptobacteroides sp.]